MYLNSHHSTWGMVYLIHHGQAIVSLSLPGAKKTEFLKNDAYETYNQSPHPFAQKCFDQLDDYFLNKRKNFDLPLDQAGTDFQKKVWDALCTVPYGETCSYKNLAEKIKHPKAYRAVGMANNKNKIPIIIPCHRVVGHKGQLVGYAGGVGMKEKLLHHEKYFIV